MRTSQHPVHIRLCRLLGCSLCVFDCAPHTGPGTHRTAGATTQSWPYAECTTACTGYFRSRWANNSWLLRDPRHPGAVHADTRAHTLSGTHCDACASVCVCPARGQRAWRQNGQEFMRADAPALTSCSLCGCTMRGMPEPVARKPQPFIAPLPPAPPRPARAKEDTPQHDSVDLAWPLCPPASRTWPPHCSHQRSTSVLGQAASR